MLTISRVQAASLIANFFLCTFPPRSSASKTHSWLPATANFDILYQPGSLPDVRHAKLDCLINYLSGVVAHPPAGQLTFQRRALHKPPDWQESTTLVDGRRLEVELTKTIEDVGGGGMMEVDFANKMVAVGVLTDGGTQEDVLFAIYPELFVARLVADELDDNECLVINGCERFNDYEGFGDKFRWTGDFIDKTPLDGNGSIDRQVIAVDALIFDDYESQLSAESIQRELNKFYCGLVCGRDSFKAHGVATGHWGCGIFGGDKRLKAVVQLMAVAEADLQSVIYCAVGNKDLKKDLLSLASTLTKTRCTVKDLWEAVDAFSDQMARFGPKGNDEKLLHPFIERHCRAAARARL